MPRQRVTTPGLTQSGAAPASLVPTASPYTFTNTTASPVFVMVSGGTVSLIQISNDGSTWTALGLLSGQFMLPSNYSIRIAYLTTPTITVVPL